MLRHIKQEAIAKGRDADEESKQATGAPVITYQKPEPWCTIDEYPDLQDVFDMDTFMDSNFVEKMLTVFKPRANDSVGYVYIYQR